MCVAIDVSARSIRLDLIRRTYDLFTSQTGEGSCVVDRDLSARGFVATTATAATTAIFTSLTTTSTTAAEIATIATIRAFATFGTLGAVTTIATAELATATATTTSATTRLASLLLEAVVNVEEFLLGLPSTLASGLFLALEVVCIFLFGELLSGFPLLVLL